MKIEANVEVGICEDGSIEQAVFDRIVQTIVEKISEKSLWEIREKAVAGIAASIDEKVAATYDEFMNREIVLKDRYGDRTKSYPNLRELIKERFDLYMTENVDERGNKCSDSYGYGNKRTRISYIVDRQIETASKKTTEAAVKEVADKIKAHLNDDLKKVIGTRLVELLDLDKLFKGAK